MPPSATEMTTTNSAPRTTRADYHKEALHQIRASIQPFANGGIPREQLSPVVCGGTPQPWSTLPQHGPPPTPPRIPHTSSTSSSSTSSSHPHHHHQPPSPHHHHHHHLHHYHHPPPPVPPPSSNSSTSSSSHHSHHHHRTVVNGNPPPPPPHTSTTPTPTSSSSSTCRLPPPPPPTSSTSSSIDYLPAISATKHYGYEPPPPAPPPRLPLTSSSPPPPIPSPMPPLLSRLSPSPGKCKAPTPQSSNYVNVSGSMLGSSGGPVVVPHTAPPPVMGPPPPYPTHSKPPIKVQPPLYPSRLSPNIEQRTTPPPMMVGGSLTAGAMAVASSTPSGGGSAPGLAARQAKTPTPVIMQSVRSTHVQKPILQTAVAPPSPPPASNTPPTSSSTTSLSSLSFSSSISSSSTLTSTISSPPSGVAPPPPPPPYTPACCSSTASSPYTLPPSPYPLTHSPYTLPPPSPQTLPSISPSPGTPPVQDHPSPVPLFDPPSYHSTMQAKAAAAQQQQYRGVPLSSIPLQDTPMQELDLSSTPLAHIPIDTEAPSSPYSHECEMNLPPPPPPPSAPHFRLRSSGPPLPPVIEVGGSPRSASPVSSVTSHETHALSPSPVSCLSTATSSPSTQSDMTHESGYSSSSQSAAARGIMAPPPPLHPPPMISSSSHRQLSAASSSSTASTITLCPDTIAMPPPPMPPLSTSSATPSSSHKTMHHSPIPQRKKIAPSHDFEARVKCSPEAYKFYMEQHMENIIKNAEARKHREMQLELEMKKIGLSTKDQLEMRKVLCQKESNFIRLKRAKMDKSMFQTIKTIGVGAFGEVTLVRKDDSSKLYAMKTLRKSDVLKRNQMAHVKAERDILAESDNDWVVKLYYSFQDADNLYFIMDYIPGGDLMSLLIKFGIFKEPLARFYIAELVCAIESVHKMGFIHRDIKPDNILIDSDGHIKLTDFGLCTGFRWTHNSRYYQKKGDHSRQESMDPCSDNDMVCRCGDLKPLERRRRRQHLRCLAHSLVGTPNYIAPEVLARTGYTQLCDWWSVGVILYEMLVGQPPFLANTPAETQYKVLNWESTLRIPNQANMSNEAKNLILSLCSGPESRLGRNAQEIKAHPFFAEVDFDGGIRKQQALYIPEIKYPTDTSNFDPIEPDRLRSDEVEADWIDTNQPLHAFYEFTFRRFFDSTPSAGVGGMSGGAALSTHSDGASGGADAGSSDDKDGQNPVYV